ncbi:PIN domain-containing protein [Microbacterium testaceum]|uniref:PIN domain-containing protein n=1 Tax=Microbacterium testaceum TaxID=2033 RepID=UPI0025B0A85B|nr:PIN domain-containing protein [Microbacterium testaceum]WJS89739.1 PIN domain-containing protein [Microbacterium testaceum]
MLLIFPDTNAFFSDYLMRGDASRAFLGLLSRGSVMVSLSPVVVGEANRHLRENVDKLVRELRGSLANVRRSFSIDEDLTDRLTESIQSELSGQSADALRPLLEHDACVVLDWSTVRAEELVQRELDRRKPNLEAGSGQSIGLRDTVIWHNFLEALARLDGEDLAVFVSNDKAFAEGGTFHENLTDEIVRLGSIPSDSVKVVATLGEAMQEVRRFAKLISDREETLIDALVDWVYGLDAFDWEGFPTRNDALMDSTLPEGLKDIELTVVPKLSVYEVGEGNPANCIAANELVFRARMSTFDFVEATDDRLTIVGQTPNPDELTVEFRVEAEVQAEIETEPGARYARVLSASVSWDA